MKNQLNESIKIRQFMFSIICFMMANSLLTSFVIKSTKQDTWLAVIISLPICIVFIWMYMQLSKRYPGKNLIEITIMVFGKILGTIISAFYLFFFLSIVALNTMDMGNLVTSMMMPETPPVALIIMFVFICAMAVRKGINTISRVAFLIVIIGIVLFAINGILLTQNIDFTNFQPSFIQNMMDYVQGVHIITTIPFGEIFVFMMIVPKVEPKKKVWRSYIGGLIIGAVMFLYIVLRDWAVAGNTELFLSLPSFQIIRLIDVAEVFTRMEVLYAIMVTALLFFKVCILYYALVMGIAQLFKMDSYEPITIVTGIVIAVYSLFVFKSGAENEFWGVHTAAFFNTFFVLVLPLVTLLTMLAKEKFKKQPSVDCSKI